jgi:VanZ family protein
MPLLVWMGLIFHFSSSAGSTGHSEPLVKRVLHWISPGFAATLSPEQLDRLDFGVRKTLHVSEYLVLTLLAFRAFRFGRKEKPFRHAVLAGAASVLYAAGDELHQAFVPGRSASVGDVGIDSIGVAAAVLLIVLHTLSGRADDLLSRDTAQHAGTHPPLSCLL